MEKMKVRITDKTINERVKKIRDEKRTNTHFFGVFPLDLINADIVCDIMKTFKSLNCINFVVRIKNDDDVPIDMVGIELIQPINYDSHPLLMISMNSGTTISV